jgi:hypothetical protein
VLFLLMFDFVIKLMETLSTKFQPLACSHVITQDPLYDILHTIVNL